MIQECFPNHKGLMFNPELLVEIRADKGDFNEEHFFYQLAQYKKAIVIMDKPINLNILAQFKPNIQMLAFKITETDNVEFLRQLESLGIKLVLVSELPQARVDELKIKYYEFGIINRVDEPSADKINELKKDADNLYYRSAKLTASKDNIYSSQAAALSDIPTKTLDEYTKVIDSEEFWKEIDFYIIVKKK
jgi:chemotaxis response regulator CheB